MSLQTRPLTPGFGVEVLNVDLSQMNEGLAAAIMDALVEHGLLLFRRQSLDDDEIYGVCSALGPVEEPAALKYHSPKYKEINYISNLMDDTARPIGGLTNKTDQDEGVWHSDQAFRARPATLSTLFCVHNPDEGGQTSFTSTTMGHDALPEHLRSRLQGLRGKFKPAAVHDVDKVEVTHPAVLVNPVTQRRALYVSPNTRGFEGLSAEEGEALQQEVLGYLIRDEHRYTHDWRMGDMLIYDNAQVIHRREKFAGLRWLKATRTFAPRQRFAVPD